MEEPAGFPQIRRVMCTQAPGSELRGGRGPLPEIYRRPAGDQVTASAPSRQEIGRQSPERVPQESPSPGRRGSSCLPGSCHGAWSCSPRPRFPAHEGLLRTPRTGSQRFLHREGSLSSGGLRSKRSHSLLGWFSTDKRVEDPASKSAAWGQGGGVSAKARLSAAQAGRRPDSPRENGSVGVGHARLGPLHRSRNRGWHPVQAPGP